MVLIEDIPNVMRSAYVDGNFHESLSPLKNQGYELISLEENASLRIQEGIDSFVSQNGNWVKEGVLFIPLQGAFLTRNSVVLKDSSKATRKHGSGKKYFVSDEQVEELKRDSLKIPFGDYGSNNSDKLKIPTNRFKDNDIARFCFGDRAEDYGKFLGEAGTPIMRLENNTNYEWVSKQKGPYFNQLVFHGLRDFSFIYLNAGLNHNNGSRGIKRVPKNWV